MSKQVKEFRNIFLPYCLKLLSNGFYIVLNRDYKPLGVSSDEFVDYEKHESVAKIKITKAKAKMISFRESEDLETIYLYNDGCIPTASAGNMNAYLKRIAVLAKVDVDVSDA